MNSPTNPPHGRSQPATRIARFALSLALAAAGLTHAQMPGPSSGPVIYPAKDQSAKQQGQDKYECYEWARAQSGFDPTQQGQPIASGQPGSSNGMAGSMVVGAAGGAAVAGLTHHDAGRGAAIGALGGGALEKFKEAQAAQTKQQQAAQQQAVRGQQRATYDRAFGACLEARGYVVK